MSETPKASKAPKKPEAPKPLAGAVEASSCTRGDGEKAYIEQFDAHIACTPGPYVIDLNKAQLCAAFLVFLLSNPNARKLHAPYGLRLKNAAITGALNLDSLEIPFPVVFECCTFADKLVMRDAKTRLLRFIGCTLPLGIRADRLKVESSCVMRSCNIHKGVTLNGADISGNLDFRGTHIDAREEGGDFAKDDRSLKALDAGGLVVGGHVLFGKKKETGAKEPEECEAKGLEDAALPNAVGILRLGGAKIGRDIIFKGGEYLSCFDGDIRSDPDKKKYEKACPHERKHLETLDLDNAYISGDMIFEGGATFRGTIHHVKTTVDGHLRYEDVCLDTPHFYAVHGDGVRVGGATFFGSSWIQKGDENKKGCCIQGIVKLTRGMFGDGLYFRHVTFAHDHERSKQYHKFTAENVGGALFLAPGTMADEIILHGLNLRNGTVKGSFVWRDIRGAEEIAIDLFEADIETFVDDFKDKPRKDDAFTSWPPLGRVNFDGLKVFSVQGLSERTRDYEEFMRERMAASPRGGVDKGMLSSLAVFGGLFFIFSVCGMAIAALCFALLILAGYLVCGAKNKSLCRGKAGAHVFCPRSFNWLVNVSRAHGHDRLANNIAIMRERERRMAGGVWRYISSFLLWVLVGNGYEFKRTLAILVAYILLSTAYFHDAVALNHLDALGRGAQGAIVECRGWVKQESCIPKFNPLLYSLDTIVPIVDLQQSQYYVPANDWDLEGKLTGGALQNTGITIDHYAAMSGWKIVDAAPRLVYWFNTFFGWLMTTVIVAALTPLVRRDD